MELPDRSFDAFRRNLNWNMLKGGAKICYVTQPQETSEKKNDRRTMTGKITGDTKQVNIVLTEPHYAGPPRESLTLSLVNLSQVGRNFQRAGMDIRHMFVNGI